MTKDEALKLALEALEHGVSTCFTQYSHEQVMSRPEHFINQAITAIKEALAQPEQKPVAWVSDLNFDRDTEIIPQEKKTQLGTNGLQIALYTKEQL